MNIGEVSTEDEEFADGVESSETDSINMSSFTRQLFACASSIIAALTAGLMADRHYKQFGKWQFQSEYGPGSFDYYSHTPLWGDATGTILAIPCLYFLGRKISLVISHIFFLAIVLVLKYIDEAGLDKLPLDFYGTIVLRVSARLYIVVMVVYVVEIAEPAYRAFFVSCVFPLYLIGAYNGRYNSLVQQYYLVLAIISQIIATIFAVLAPETPYWLALKGQYEPAQEMFLWLRANIDKNNEFDVMFDGAAVDAERRGITNLFAPVFVIPLVKIFFMYVATDSVCMALEARLSRSSAFFFLFNSNYAHIFGFAAPFYYPIVGSIIFLFLCFKFGRRSLYLGSVILSYLLYLYFWFSYLFYHKIEMLGLHVFEEMYQNLVCYTLAQLGGRPVLLLLPAEIFPGTVREFGVAASGLFQLSFTLSDFQNVEDIRKEGHIYTIMRLAMTAAGIGFTALFMPETKNLTLREAEEQGIDLPLPVISFLDEEPDLVEEQE